MVALVVSTIAPGPLAASTFSFDLSYVDQNYGGNGRPGWVHAGDMDGDGDQDLIAGGGFALYIYENNGSATGWTRYGNLDSTGEIGSNGAVIVDVDKDGDLDVISAKYNSDPGWWEHPDQSLSDAPWTYHRITVGDGAFAHDIVLTDLNGDGIEEEVVFVVQYGYWDAPFTVFWLIAGPNPKLFWQKNIVAQKQRGPANNHSGVDAADIDGDGDTDLAVSNGWYESSGNPESDWTWHPITNIYGLSNSLVRDMDNDGDADLVVSAGHHGQGVFWFENNGKRTAHSWSRHDISGTDGDITTRHVYRRSIEGGKHAHHPECLAVLDLDLDMDMDVISCDLFFGEDPDEPAWNDRAANVYVYENLGGGLSWQRTNVAPMTFASHLLKPVDVNLDGSIDLISESTGHSVISYFQNSSNPATLPLPSPSTGSINFQP